MYSLEGCRSTVELIPQLPSLTLGIDHKSQDIFAYAPDRAQAHKSQDNTSYLCSGAIVLLCSCNMVERGGFGALRPSSNSGLRVGHPQNLFPPARRDFAPFESSSKMFTWWRGEDSNLRRHRQQIYSLSPLAARESLRFGLSQIANCLLLIVFYLYDLR